MFRARIYAQGFTLLALVGGSIFWQDERMKRKQLEKAMEQKKAAEKREKWLKELEDRDREDREWRQRFEGVAARAREVEKGASGVVKEKIGQGAGKMEEGVEMVKEETKEGAKKGKESMKQAIEKAFQNKSVLEQVDRSGWGRGMWMVREAWRRS